MDFNFDNIKIVFETLKNAIGLMKEAKDLMPDSEKKKTLVSSLDTAERTTALAEAQFAVSLGYEICKCTFPPQIMLSIGYRGAMESYQCPKCKNVYPNPTLPYVDTGESPNSWMAK